MANTKKCGLVLGVGAAPGLAHIGVIKVLRQQNLAFDRIAGTSIGAFIGACFAKDGDISKVEKAFLEMDLSKLPKLIDPKFNVLSKGLLSGDKVKDFLRSLIGDVTFQELKIPLAVVAADVDTGEEVVFQEGSVVDAVRASISMPGIFVPVCRDGRYLIDGGSVNPLPVDIIQKMGAGFTVVSNIVPSPGQRETSRKSPQFMRKKENIFRRWVRRLSTTSAREEEQMPDMFSVLTQAMHITEYKIVSSRLKEADLVITPDTQGIDVLDFMKAREAIQKGENAACEALRDTDIF